MIQKYKNGVILLKPDESDYNRDGTVKESFYHDDMFMQDLSIEQLDDLDFYVIDNNTERAYRLGSYLMQNPLKELLDELQEKKMIFLRPIDAREARMMIRKLYQEDLPYGLDEITEEKMFMDEQNMLDREARDED